MKIERFIKVFKVFAVIVFLSITSAAGAASFVSNDAEVRSVVRQTFEQLKSGRYDSLYDALPSRSRARVSRERFTNALRRSQDMYELERLEIGAVRVDGDFAVADTVMYGRVRRPLEGEGKIVAQQYMVREDGKWRVATGDRATVERFLAAHPRIAKKFGVREPRVYMKRDGRWIDLSDSLKAVTRRGAK